uniref:MALT1 paracaspase n=1 Tax=Oncorhynchus kisutch TaxID=8019 RepID=A0A8C7GUM8_ONCKI
MSDSSDRSLNLNFLKEPVLRKLCEALDKTNSKGWRKLGEMIGNDRRFRVSSDEMEMCSLKVLELEGSPSRVLLRLMGDRGCTLGHLVDLLQTMGHTEALQCVKPPGIQILIQPQSVAIIVGHNLRLSCYAVGKAGVQFQWFKTKEEVGSLLGCVLKVDHAGFYICRVNCGDSFEFSQWAQVDVLNVATSYGETLSFTSQSVHGQRSTDKVALLIGNLSYRNHPQLKAPMVDVYDLTNLLRQLNFKVVSLLDLTESEMRNAVDEFLLLLHKGVYGLLYYAGHGYENYGNSFMVPVDAPNPYHSANCLCVQSILKLMQEKETGLNVFLLDMCRKRNIHDDTTPNILLRVTANIVFGYATCQDAEAFELSSSGFTNGVFVKFLKKRLLEDEKITVLLDRVAEDMGQFDATKGKQALEIRSSLSERRALTDPVLPGDSSDMALAHNRQWAKAHELPESMSLDFDCGAQIKLGFAAEFSNVLVIYTHIVKKPEDMFFCQAHVTNFSPDLDIDPKEMNRETPEETGIYLLSSSLPQHCLYTRLSSLQKLRDQLGFTVCLQGSFKAMDELVDWTTDVNIGKPLIARLDLYRTMRRNSCLQTCPMPHSPCHSPRAEHLHHHPQGLLSPHCSSPYLDVCEPLQGAVGGSGCVSSTLYDNCFSRYGCTSSDSPGRASIPIETTDDINELQTVFINSLQFHHQ